MLDKFAEAINAMHHVPTQLLLVVGLTTFNRGRASTLLIRHELNMITVRPEPVEGLCFDRLSTNESADKSGRINNENVWLLDGAEGRPQNPKEKLRVNRW